MCPLLCMHKAFSDFEEDACCLRFLCAQELLTLENILWPLSCTQPLCSILLEVYDP